MGTAKPMPMKKFCSVGFSRAVTIPTTLASGLYVPIYACRQLNVPVVQFLIQAAGGPVLCVLPYTAVLVASRILFADEPLAALGLGMAAGGAVLGPLYYRFIAPVSLRQRIQSWLGRHKVGASASPRGLEESAS